jgi:cytoskeletal protein CcmA (bactofilin family)
MGEREKRQPEQISSREVVMFSNETDKLGSLLGMKSSFKGDLKVKGTLRIDGVVDGQVDADYVILSETAEVTGEIRAKKIIIGGKMDGNARAQELVEIKSKGKVWGDIFTQKLTIIEGAEFNGKVEMKKTEMRKEGNKVIELELKGREAGKV